MKKADVFFIMASVYFARVVSPETAVAVGLVCLAVGFVILRRGD